MNARERNLLIATVLIMAILIGYFVLSGDDAPTTTASAEGGVPSSGALKSAQKQYASNLKTLNQAKSIKREYKAIEIGVTQTDGSRRPEAVLGNQLFELLRDRLHIANPNVGKPNLAEIPRVEEYCYIEIPVEIPGSYWQVINLLTEMNRLGLLIKTFKINAIGRNGEDQVDLNITVSRLVKVDDTIRRRLRLNRRSDSA